VESIGFAVGTELLLNGVLQGADALTIVGALVLFGAAATALVGALVTMRAGRPALRGGIGRASAAVAS
jgi:hypothetical protein